MSDDKNISLSQQEYINLMAHKITHDVVAETKVDIDRLRNDVDAKFNELKTSINQRFEQVDKRFEQVNDKFGESKTSINQRFEQIDKRIDRMQTFLYWIVGIGITSIIVPIALPLVKIHL
ncbi:hypothetical protein IB642_02510 [Allofrancisella guangzhouensis]|uniref:hypothetical protein n=1 Tax=Allofrancisella guangzhouensis TaxID=594679 RepID=UPI00068A3B15|nr:hypothetical protein [Allofrancisella guangzhouensis]MBK2026981.1 hypothetical protein [Allofrancisella guangzhouensis]MBK2043889.1 hypothetical protein [Allofrancisella guangzhouensis]MBK2044998.1 hypothetical protein [Allofrancisella guangzhouensis]